MREFALQFVGRQWPIFRLSANSKLPLRGSHGFKDATTDPAIVEQWWLERPGCNVALATGRIVVIDPDGAEAIQRLTAIGQKHGGWPETLTAQTPRSIHLYYLAPEGVDLRSYNEPRAKKGDQGIDVKAHGGYCVLPPSKTKNGNYQWLNSLPLNILPDWAVIWIRSLKQSPENTTVTAIGSVGADFAKKRPSYLKQSKQSQNVTRFAQSGMGGYWTAYEEKRVRSALAAIPAKGYDRWVQVGMALSSLQWDRPDGTSLGFDLFDEWSSTEPDLYSLDGTEKKWASFGRGRSGVGIGSLFHVAELCGWTGLLPQASPEPYTNGHHAGPAVAPLVFTAPDRDSPLIELNAKYACIGDVGGKCLVLGWVPSKVDPVNEVPSFQTFKSFAERYGHKYVDVVNDKKHDDHGEPVVESKQLGPYWLKWGQRRSFEGIDLVPGQGPVVGNNVMNLWRGFAAVPAAGCWDRMKVHIAEVLADGDPAAVEYIVKWAAWAVQNPGERAEAALVLRGGKGSGKGTFAHALRRMFGVHGLHIANPKHLVGAFNAHLRNCLLLYADEAFWAGDKQGESTLKALITESTLTIEQKGVDAVQWHNRIHLIMTANAEWVVPASHDERRYVVLNVSEKYVDNERYFNELYAELENGGLSAMLYDLQAVDLKGWHPRKILRTEALLQQKMQSMNPLQEWFAEMLENGSIPAAPKDTPDIAMANYLLNHAREFGPRMKELTPTRLGRFLADHGCIKLHRASGNAWRFPILEEARAKWSAQYVGWKWEAAGGKWTVKV